MNKKFDFCITCLPENGKHLISECNTVANVISNKYHNILICLQNIYAPKVSYNLRHIGNDKAYNYTYSISSSIADTDDIEYARLPVLIFDTLGTVLKIIYNHDSDEIATDVEAVCRDCVAKIMAVTKYKLTDDKHLLIVNYLIKLAKSLQKHSSNVKVLLFKSASNGIDELHNDDQPIAVPVVPLPLVADDEHAECLDEVLLSYRIKYNSKIDGLSLHPTAKGQHKRLCYDIKALEKLSCIINEMLTDCVAVVCDINPNADNCLRVVDVAPAQNTE